MKQLYKRIHNIIFQRKTAYSQISSFILRANNGAMCVCVCVCYTQSTYIFTSIIEEQCTCHAQKLMCAYIYVCTYKVLVLLAAGDKSDREENLREGNFRTINVQRVKIRGCVISCQLDAARAQFRLQQNGITISICALSLSLCEFPAAPCQFYLQRAPLIHTRFCPCTLPQNHQKVSHIYIYVYTQLHTPLSLCFPILSFILHSCLIYSFFSFAFY